MSEQLSKLMEAARGKPMSGEEREAQRRSFAFGNAHIENSRVTREMVEAAADKIGKLRQMTDAQRHSIAAEPSLLSDQDEIAQRESENAIAQFDRMLEMVDEVSRGSRPFRLRTSMILDLHRIALLGLSPYAGNFRPSDVEIGKSKHTPPSAHLVPGLVEEMCEYVMENSETSDPLHLCAYVMWRLNQIHPFTDGNGRTSRALAYYVLCGRLGYLLPGGETVPEQIAADRDPYYLALEDADQHWADGQLNLLALETLLDQCLATQLLSAYNDAKHPPSSAPKDRKLH